VRQHDPDSFAWAVLLPKEERARILALRALNVETLLIPSSAVRRSAGDGAQAMLRIRYQWWRDAVRAAMEAPAVAEAREDEEDDGEVETEDDDNQEEAGTTATTAPTPSASRRARLSPKTTPPTPPAHPVVTALWAARASAGPRLQRYPLRRLIDAREREALSAAAGEPPPLRLSDLEAHAEATHAQLLYAQLAAIGGGEGKSNNNSSAADHAASHAGKAVGLAMALRGLPYAAAQRRCVLPLEVCASAGLSQEDLFRRASAIESGRQPSPEEWSPKADAALRDAVLEVASRAVGHLQEARALAKGGGGGGGNGRASSSSSSFGKGQAHALLPAVAADLYLQALERTAQFDVFHPALRPPPTTTKKGAEEPPPPPPPLGAGLGVSPLRYLLSLRWHAWRGTF
jgi:NADH dehydrogenase [ubiquinone] 1 alpha subcomplex assembly factor 6